MVSSSNGIFHGILYKSTQISTKSGETERGEQFEWNPVFVVSLWKNRYRPRLAKVPQRLPAKFSVSVVRKLEHQRQERKCRAKPSLYCRGAGAGNHLQANRNAFDQLADCSANVKRCFPAGCFITGQRLHCTTLFAPVGSWNGSCKADIAITKAAARLTPRISFSNQASKGRWRRCAEVMGNSPKWFQLYWSKSNDLVLSFLQRAERCGCKSTGSYARYNVAWMANPRPGRCLSSVSGWKGYCAIHLRPCISKLLDEPDDSEPIKRKCYVAIGAWIDFDG